MMVETMLEYAQDFGMSNGSLPQWKRELLQRRAARSRPAPAPPPAPPAADDDEELRYGPGIVKRLKSRYLSLALRDAPRRRPSVLRRAASLEHLLDERPPPAPRPRAPRPASVAAPPPARPAPRRDAVKRARSVDALSRLDARDDAPPSPPTPPPPPALPPPAAPRPPATRAARPPRRPAPLLRDAERPPLDVVRSTLRKFETAPTRRPAPAARVAAVLRCLDGPSRTSTPEPPTPPPLPPTPPPAETGAPTSLDEVEGGGASVEARPVSRAALEGIARAGSSMRFAFEAPRRGSHLPPLAATNPVLLGRARRVGVIRPMPAPTLRSPTIRSPEPPSTVDLDRKLASPPTTPRLTSPTPPEPELSPPPRPERKEAPPAALVEPIPRPPPATRAIESPLPCSPPPEPLDTRPLVNGHAEPEPPPSRLGAAEVERAWNGTPERKPPVEIKEKKIVEMKEVKGGAAWAGGSPLGGRRGRAPAPAATSIVFNFSDRKEVPDYIENDGIVLRGCRRNRVKQAGEPGVVVLRPEALTVDASSEEEEAGPPSPCSVRFVNDNVLINGRSCIPNRPNRDRIAKLKLQFDDSLTRTHEYPSETSLCDLDDPAPASSLVANTHIASAALSRYTPSKTLADAFQLGVTRHHRAENGTEGLVSAGAEAEAGADSGDARPCAADAARSWSDARAAATDLLF